MIVFVLGILACFLVGDILHRLGAAAEVSRKSVHVGTCLLIAMFPQFGMDYRELLLVGAGSFVALASLRGTALLRSIMSVERRSYGELWLPFSVMATSLIEFEYPAFLAAFLVLGVSDTLASLVGGAPTRRRYVLLGHAKSYAGSAAFFLSASAIICAVALFAGVSVAMALTIAIAIGAVLTLVEALSHKGTDNLFVPLIAAASLQPLLPA